MYFHFKRVLDLLISLTLLLVLSIIFLLISLIIKINSSRGPILYRGKRTSKNGGIFFVLKFRTMIVDAEHKGGFSTAINDERLTSIGRFLRKYKLDELPQLINVLKGDMSLVGPRPQVSYYTDKYKGDEKLILSLKPGITDLSSLIFLDMDKVLGSKNVDEKYENEIEPVKNKYRIEYAKIISFKTDFIILFCTFLAITGIGKKYIKNILSYTLNIKT